MEERNMNTARSSVVLEERRVSKLQNRAVLLISCPEDLDVISAVSNCLVYNKATISQLDQHTTDPYEGMLFIRFEIQLDSDEKAVNQLKIDLQALANKYNMNWKLKTDTEIKRMAVFVSKMDQHLLELILRTQTKEIPVEIALVISNHPDLKETVEYYGIPYYHIPITPETKAEAECKELQLLANAEVDFIVLSRYMQILSPQFISNYENRIINIHHSLLPAFIGARPYDRAYERGVKFIGATAHYVTSDLDAGPIIHQDVHRVSHRHRAQDLKVIGSHVEKSVLAQAVTFHADDRVIVHENKTIIF